MLINLNFCRYIFSPTQFSSHWHIHHTCCYTHTHTQQSTLLRQDWQWPRSVIGSELQLQQKTLSCWKPVSIWHLLPSFSFAGQQDVTWLTDMCYNSSSNYFCYNTSVRAEALAEMTCLSLMRTLRLHVEWDKRQNRERLQEQIGSKQRAKQTLTQQEANKYRSFIK